MCRTASDVIKSSPIISIIKNLYPSRWEALIWPAKAAAGVSRKEGNYVKKLCSWPAYQSEWQRASVNCAFTHHIPLALPHIALPFSTCPQWILPHNCHRLWKNNWPLILQRPEIKSVPRHVPVSWHWHILFSRPQNNAETQLYAMCRHVCCVEGGKKVGGSGKVTPLPQSWPRRTHAFLLPSWSSWSQL